MRLDLGLGLQIGMENTFMGGGLRERVQASMRGWGRKRIGAGDATGGLGVQVGLWGGLMVP